jgi:hypothetical protein
MKRPWLMAIGLSVACAGRTEQVEHRFAVAQPVSLSKPRSIATARAVSNLPVHWSIRAFPQVSLSIALPEDGVELGAAELGQMQALVGIGFRTKARAGATYVLLVYPISNPLQGASLEQRLLLLPYLLNELGPDASRKPVDIDGLHGVQFVTEKDGWFQRALVFATPRTVVALIVKSPDLNQTTDSAARLFFESLQWYDE